MLQVFFESWFVCFLSHEIVYLGIGEQDCHNFACKLSEPVLPCPTIGHWDHLHQHVDRTHGRYLSHHHRCAISILICKLSTWYIYITTIVFKPSREREEIWKNWRFQFPRMHNFLRRFRQRDILKLPNHCGKMPGAHVWWSWAFEVRKFYSWRMYTIDISNVYMYIHVNINIYVLRVV